MKNLVLNDKILLTFSGSATNFIEKKYLLDEMYKLDKYQVLLGTFMVLQCRLNSTLQSNITNKLIKVY